MLSSCSTMGQTMRSHVLMRVTMVIMVVVVVVVMIVKTSTSQPSRLLWVLMHGALDLEPHDQVPAEPLAAASQQPDLWADRGSLLTLARKDMHPSHR